MTQTNPTATSIEVMWRPGCPFCGSLRRGLSRGLVESLVIRVTAVSSSPPPLPPPPLPQAATIVRQVVSPMAAVRPRRAFLPFSWIVMCAPFESTLGLTRPRILLGGSNGGVDNVVTAP